MKIELQVERLYYTYLLSTTKLPKHTRMTVDMYVNCQSERWQIILLKPNKNTEMLNLYTAISRRTVSETVVFRHHGSLVKVTPQTSEHYGI